MTDPKDIARGIATKGLTVDRRTFLVGSSTVLATSAVDMAGAEGLREASPERDKIILRLSDDGRQVVAYEAYADEKGIVSPICSADRVLHIHAGSFGPDATFVLGRPFQTDAKKHIIYIDNAAAGGVAGLRDSLLFERTNEKAIWNISFESALWGAIRRFGPKPLRQFTAGLPLDAKIEGPAFAKTIQRISGGRLSGGERGDWKATLDQRFVLRISNEASRLTAFGGRLKGISTLQMDWDLDAIFSDGTVSKTEGNSRDVRCGFVEVDQQSTEIFRIQSSDVAIEGLSFADAQKRAVTLRANGAATKGNLVVLHRPHGDVTTAPIATLELRNVRVEVNEGEQAGSAIPSLQAQDVLLIESRQDGAKSASPVRIVISGDLAEATPVEYRTAAGVFLLSNPPAEAILSSVTSATNTLPSKTKRQSQGDPSRTKARLDATIDAKGTSSPPSDSAAIEPSASRQAFDRYLALLAHERPFDDKASLHIAAYMADRHDAAPIALQRVQIRATLHATDTALEGSEWSRLRFGVPQLAMRRATSANSKKEPPSVPAPPPTEGTPLELVYPMSDGPRSGVDSVVALLPEPGMTVANISMTRARLDVGVGGSLVDLRFGFRGLSLVLKDHKDRGAELIPDNTACGVIQTPSGAVVDTRPIVMLELPPSAVLEEAWFQPLQVKNADERLSNTLTRAEKVIKARRKKYFPDSPSQTIEATVEIARRREGDAESADGLYTMWREFFRKVRESCDEPTEYYSPPNREHLTQDARKRIDDVAKKLQPKFVKDLEKPPIPPDSMRAHLGGGSRLSFRLNCSAASEDLDRLEGLAFSLQALTNLGRHEPAVSRRAEVLVRARPDGVISAIGSAPLDNIEGTDILAFQGIKDGPRTVFAHMDAVSAALAKGPEPHETALELVARLILSTSQRAVYLTDADPPEDIFSPQTMDIASDRLLEPLLSCKKETLHRLWSVRLVTRSLIGPQPSDMRVIATPDFRPEALRPWPNGPRGEVHGAPPYGNAAPWMMPRAAALEAESAQRGLLQRLKRTMSGEAAEELRAREFRAGLSANDRHQLLLLTSAYGLPVIGKRQSDDAGNWGDLIKDSDQFEPGKYLLGELDAGHAIYAPRTLDVEELSLSALGATFRHRTVFNPPLPALLRRKRGAPQMFDGRPAFDGLSVEKWDHRSHQGRNEFDGVSYKGYLLPSGHRATLEKKTTREIVETKDGNLRAISIQRMYIKVADPLLKFKRLEQPYGGRCWLDGPMSVTVPSGGEIMDPYEVAGGRVDQIDVGLAFWPTRVDSTEPLQFNITVGGGTAEAPMLFVDNVAAGDPAMLSKLVGIYNETDEARRTWSFGKAKLRYAHGLKEGDTDLTTTSIIVRATGRNSVPKPLESWTGPNEEFGFTPALEGDGKPPFFPAIERAEIVLDDVGTLTGGPPPTVMAYYDGEYVRGGFDAAQNPLGVFMHFGPKGAGYDMGSNGDRTPLNRPNQTLYAVSLRGPLGYRDPTFQKGPGQTPISLDGSFNNGADGTLVSLVHLFNTETTGQQQAQGATPALAGAGSAPLSQPKDVRSIAQDCFPLNAKALLGTITYGDLFKLVDTSGGLDKILPALEQAVTFGLAVSDKLEDELKFLKDTVLVPASRVLAEFESQWTLLEKTVNDRLKGREHPYLSLAMVFPEIAEGKDLLRWRLDETIGEDDLTRIPDRLSELYVAGRRFLNALGDFASHPAETLAANMRALLDDKMGRVRAVLIGLGLPPAIAQAVDKLPADPDQLRTWLAEEAASAVLAEAEGAIPARLLLLPWPDVPATGAELAALVQILDQTFGVAKLDAKALPAAIATILEQSATGTEIATVLVAPLKTAVQNARSRIASDPAIGKATKGKAKVILDNYELRLVSLQTGADTPLTTAVLGRLKAEGDRLNDLRRALIGLKVATAKRDIGGTLGSLATIARIAGLAETADNIRYLSETLTSAARGFVDQVAAALPALTITNDVRNACQTWREKPSVTDPASGILKLTSLPEPLASIRKVMSDAGDVLAKIDAKPNGVRQVFADNRASIAAFDTDTATTIAAGIKATSSYVGDSTTTGLVADGAELFCGVVEFNDAVEGLRLTLSRNVLTDPASLQAAALSLRDVLRRRIQAPLERIVSETGSYIENQGTLLGGAAILVTLKAIADRGGITEDVKKAATAVHDRLQQFQGDMAAFAADLLDTLNRMLAIFEETVRKPLVWVGVTLDKATSALPPTLWDKTSTELLNEAKTVLEGLGSEAFAPFVKATGPNQSPIDLLLQAKRALPDGGARTLADAIKFGSFLPSDKSIGKIDTAIQRLLQHTKGRLEGLPSKALEAFDAPAAALIGRGAGGLRSIYENLLQAREDLEEWIAANASWITATARDRALSPPEGDQDALTDEVKLIRGLPETKTPLSNPKDREKVVAVARRFTNGQPAPVLIAKGIGELTEQVVRGDILSLIDITALRDEIEDRLSALVPTRRTISYRFGVELTPEGQDSKSIFRPKAGTRFDVGFRSEIDLLHPNDFTFESTGEIGPFDVSLVAFLGLDAITLKFGGARFQTGRGTKPSFDCNFRDFEIGEALKFLEELKKSLPIGESGVYIEPLTWTSGLRVGYALDIGVVPLGTMSFVNVSVALAADLPFTDTDALFSVSVGRRLAPVGVNATPFGGSAYLSILSTAREIVGFEFGLEFGFGGAYTIGPLVAQGRVQAGFAVRTINVGGMKATEISGTFFAGGSASIWIFTFSACLYVRLTHNTDDGGMRGEAVYAFSFKAGFVKFSYQVRVTYGQDALGGESSGGAQRRASLDFPYPSDRGEKRILLAEADLGTRTDATPGPTWARSQTAKSEPLTSADAKLTTVGMEDDWDKYSGYFDEDLLKRKT